MAEASVPTRSLGILAIRSSTVSEGGGGGASTSPIEDDRSLFLPPRGGGGGGAVWDVFLDVLDVLDLDLDVLDVLDLDLEVLDFEDFDFERNFATTRRGGVEAEVERRRVPSASVSMRWTVSMKRRFE